jgi:hypothetical protein
MHFLKGKEEKKQGGARKVERSKTKGPPLPPEAAIATRSPGLNSRLSTIVL